jgi:hypothetical protein
MVQHSQTTDHVLMINPNAFLYNADTGTDNIFMSQASADDIEKAKKEWENVYSTLAGKVRVTVFESRQDTPDAVFCNNWFSTFGGKFALYPLKAKTRRLERNMDIVHAIKKNLDLVDFSLLEERNEYLESTGSLVLDHVLKLAFVCLSERATETAIEKWSLQFPEYKIIRYHASIRGKPVYHTNVIQSIGTQFAIVCTECIEDIQRDAMLANLKHKRVVEISVDQVDAFCGNVLEIGKDRKILCMSTSARAAFLPEQLEVLEESVDEIVAIDLTAIQRVGGGGMRCLLGEIFEMS